MRKLGPLTLALVNVAIVGNLQTLPALASYGYSLFFFYAIAVVCFFIPCILITAELATTWPIAGGAYIWTEQAFGKKCGFFTVCILWFCNLIWYPAILSLIATGCAYLIDPTLAHNKSFMLIAIISLFWAMTMLNCRGIHLSSLTSAVAGIIGIILPSLIVILCALNWTSRGNTTQISFSLKALTPNFQNIDDLAFLIAVVISLFGIEMSAVHAADVRNPKRDYPLSLFYSAIIILTIVIGASLAIALVVPKNEINLVSGLLDALFIFFKDNHLSNFIPLILLLIIIGNIGSVTAWMLSSTRAMFVASKYNDLPTLFQKTNSHQAPVGVLLLEASIVTIICAVFLLFPTINNSYWLLLDMASQISLIYYIILFLTAICLHYKKHASIANAFYVPGGTVFLLCSLLGIITSLLAIGIGFLPPPDLTANKIAMFRELLLLGISTALLLPYLLLKMSRNS